MKILNLAEQAPECSTRQYIDIRDIIIHKGFSILLRLLAPITPHITHQLWQDLHYDGIILDATWPKSSPIVFKVDTIELVVQVNGKLRSRIAFHTVPIRMSLKKPLKKIPKCNKQSMAKRLKKLSPCREISECGYRRVGIYR